MNPYVSPLVWLNRCHIRMSWVTASVSGRTADPPRQARVVPNDGMYRLTRSLSSNPPCSHSTSAATAVIGLVIE